ncbi:MAG: alpha amylase C-terminal domain-containing protein, partial [Pseudomonadota bacterium]
ALEVLQCVVREPIHRSHHHNEITFRGVYAFSENYTLPLSHDEVVHGKGSLLEKMPGDDWQKFANLRLLYGYQWAQPGKKLLFMGGEFAQVNEWDHDAELSWHLLEDDKHAGVRDLIRELNALYRSHPALHRLDCDPAGFAWIAADDAAQSVIAYLRDDGEGSQLLVVCNFTPVPRDAYRVGTPRAGEHRLLLNSDAQRFGGSDYPVSESLASAAIPYHGHGQSLELTLPPLATLILELPKS